MPSTSHNILAAANTPLTITQRVLLRYRLIPQREQETCVGVKLYLPFFLEKLLVINIFFITYYIMYGWSVFFSLERKYITTSKKNVKSKDNIIDIDRVLFWYFDIIFSKCQIRHPDVDSCH